MGRPKRLSSGLSLILGLSIALLAVGVGILGVRLFDAAVSAKTWPSSSAILAVLLLAETVPAAAVGLFVRRLRPNPILLIPTAMVGSFAGYVLLSIELSIFGANAAVVFAAVVLVLADL